MRHYDEPAKPELKADMSIVTKTDRDAERLILKGLGRAAANIPVISEEKASIGHFPKIGERFFLVDPLDGTREFVSKNGEFTVNIALVENHQPVLGVVYAPAMGRLFFASQDQAFESRYGGAAEKIKARNVPKNPVLIASRSHKDAAEQELREKYQARQIILMGSSIKFCLIAAGEADLYPRQGRTMVWDIAAGHAVLAAAGGNLQTDNGAISYGKKAPLTDLDSCANPPFLAHGALGAPEDEDEGL